MSFADSMEGNPVLEPNLTQYNKSEPFEASDENYILIWPWALAGTLGFMILLTSLIYFLSKQKKSDLKNPLLTTQVNIESPATSKDSRKKKEEIPLLEKEPSPDLPSKLNSGNPSHTNISSESNGSTCEKEKEIPRQVNENSKNEAKQCSLQNELAKIKEHVELDDTNSNHSSTIKTTDNRNYLPYIDSSSEEILYKRLPTQNGSNDESCEIKNNYISSPAKCTKLSNESLEKRQEEVIDIRKYFLTRKASEAPTLPPKLK